MMIPYDSASLCLSCGVISETPEHVQVCPACACQGLVALKSLLEPYLNFELKVHVGRLGVHDLTNYPEEYRDGE